MSNTAPVTAGLVRRLLAIIYDAFLLFALLFITAGLATALNKGHAIEPEHPFYMMYVFCLLTVCFLYFGGFWTHGGQTLGMRTWKIQLIGINEPAISWRQALLRFMVAIASWSVFGLGFIWSLFDKQGRTWHDMASQSMLTDLRHEEAST